MASKAYSSAIEVVNKIEELTLSLQDWFRSNPITTDSEIQKAKMWIFNTVEKMINNPDKTYLDYQIKFAGYFYIFNYDSELFKKEKLDAFDAFPLIFVIEKNTKGFLGLNFHWIHIKYRAIVLLQIMRLMPDKFVNDEMLYPFNWQKFKKTVYISGLKKYLRLAVRFYKWENVLINKSLKFVRIPNNEMPDAIKYTSPRYVGLTPQEIITKVRKSISKT
jgi:hypothetical protein